MKFTTLPRPHRQRGATLIEVLVSFLIISFGMLALLALQNNAIQYNKTTEYRSLATMLATDLAERMRANREQAIGGAYDMNGSSTPPDELPGRVACATPPATCTAAELAAQDVSEWQRLLFINLPGGRAHVEVINDASKDVKVTANIWVAWNDPTGTNEVAGDASDNTKECEASLISTTEATEGDTDEGTTTGEVMPTRCAFFNIGL